MGAETDENCSITKEGTAHLKTTIIIVLCVSSKINTLNGEAAKMVMMLQHVWHKKKNISDKASSRDISPLKFIFPSSLTQSSTHSHMQSHICTLSMLVKRLNFSSIITSFPDYIKPVHFLSPWTWACQGVWFLVTFGDSGRNNKYREAKDERTEGRMTTTWRDTALGGSWRLISRQLSLSLTFRS